MQVSGIRPQTYQNDKKPATPDVPPARRPQGHFWSALSQDDHPHQLCM